MKCLFINIQKPLDMLKNTLLFKKNTNFMSNNSRKLKVKNVKSSGYCFYMDSNIYWYFQICINVPLKERFNKMEIEMDSENKSQLKRMRKSPLLLNQEESLVKKVKKYPCLFDKCQGNVQTKRRFSKIFLQNLSSFFTFSLLFFEVLKTKITSCQNLRCPSSFQLSKFCVTIIATITRCEHQ